MTREEFYNLTDILNTEVLGNFMHGGEAAELIAMFEEAVEDSNILEVKEVKETMSIAYVVTRSEEHSDYVEKVFFDEDKAQEYCDQFKGNENEYARDITRVKVTL